MDGDVDGLENETTVLRRMSAGRWTWLQEMETFDDPDHDLVRSVRDLDLERAQIIRQYGQVDRQYALSKRLMKRLHRDGKHISHQIKDAERLRDEIDAEVQACERGQSVCTKAVSNKFRDNLARTHGSVTELHRQKGVVSKQKLLIRTQRRDQQSIQTRLVNLFERINSSLCPTIKGANITDRLTSLIHRVNDDMTVACRPLDKLMQDIRTRLTEGILSRSIARLAAAVDVATNLGLDERLLRRAEHELTLLRAQSLGKMTWRSHRIQSARAQQTYMRRVQAIDPPRTAFSA